MNTNTIDSLTPDEPGANGVDLAIYHREVARQSLIKLKQSMLGNQNEAGQHVIDHEDVRRKWVLFNGDYNQLTQDAKELESVAPLNLKELSVEISNGISLAKTQLPLNESNGSNAFQVANYLSMVKKANDTLTESSALQAVSEFETSLDNLKSVIKKDNGPITNEWLNLNKSTNTMLAEVRALGETSNIDLDGPMQNLKDVHEMAIEVNPQVFDIPSKTDEYSLPYMLNMVKNSVADLAGVDPDEAPSFKSPGM
jgi:hypothetical protein